MDGEEQGEGQEYLISVYIYYHNARKSASPCTDVGGAYGSRWASDGVRVTTYTPTLLGSEGSAGGPYIMHSASDDTSQLGVMVMVPCRNAAILLPIIQQHVRPGTVVWSDEWAAYRRVQQLPRGGSRVGA